MTKETRNKLIELVFLEFTIMSLIFIQVYLIRHRRPRVVAVFGFFAILAVVNFFKAVRNLRREMIRSKQEQKSQ